MVNRAESPIGSGGVEILRSVRRYPNVDDLGPNHTLGTVIITAFSGFSRRHD
jgi:hypothetical protein